MSKNYLLSIVAAGLFFGCGGGDLSDDIENAINTGVGNHDAKLEVKEISIPTSINEQSDVNVSAIVEDYYDSILWTATMGEFQNATQVTTLYTAPKVNEDTEVEIKVTACTSIEKTCHEKTKLITIYPNSASNRPPTIDSISIDGQVVEEGSTTAITAIVKDDDGDSLTYQWSTTLGSFSDQTSLSTNYIASEVNSDTKGVITLSVSDGKATQSLSIYLTIKDSTSPSDNNAPEILSVNIPSSMDINSSSTLNVLAIDTNGDALSYFWSASQGSFDSNTLQSPLFTATTTDESVTIKITVCDSNNDCASEEREVEIN